MEKIRVNARAIVDDIKERVGLKTLMEKHGLSYRHLLKVRDLLLEKGWIAREEFDYLNLPEASGPVTVPAKEFLASFRNRPDDLHLMNRFRLTAKELRKIYERLIQAGFLSEYEYHCRNRKAPELAAPHRFLRGFHRGDAAERRFRRRAGSLSDGGGSSAEGFAWE